MRRIKAVHVVPSVFILTLLLVISVIFFQPAAMTVSGTASASVPAGITNSTGIVSSPSFGQLYSNSVTVAPDYLNYIFVGTGGGDHPIGTSSFNITIQDNNGCSQNGSIIGYSHYNTASIVTKDIDYSTSGIGVNLPLDGIKAFSKDSNGVNTLNGSFSLSTRSLVLLASAGTNEGYPTIHGALGNVSSCTPWGDLGILFSYAELGPGSYKFTIHYQLWGNTTDYASSIGAVVYEFNLSATIHNYVSPASFGPLYSSSLYLPTGYLNYIYVATGGGDHPMQSPSFNVSLSESNHCSNNGSLIGYSHSNIGTMKTGDYDYSISGIGVNLPITGNKTYETDANGSHVISGNFSLISKSLVLLASAGTNQGYPSIQGSVANSSTFTPWGDLGVSFSYSMLGPGNYNFSIVYQLWGNNTDYAASTGAVLYVFNISSSVYQVKFTESGLNLSSYNWYLDLGYANYTSYSDTILASVLAGQYSYAIGIVSGNTSASPYDYPDIHGTLIVPSAKMNFTLVFNNTSISKTGVNHLTQPVLTSAIFVISYIVTASLAASALVAVLLDSHYRKRRI
jgi:hypothetical protein